MRARFSLICCLFMISSAFSSIQNDIDPHNTYQWNRENRDTGEIDTGPWYEWWYYKLIDPQTGDSFYFCYGVVNPWDQSASDKNSRAFISFGDFKNHLLLETILPASQFQSSYDRPFTRVGPHVSTDHMISAAFESKGHHVSWILSIQKKVAWDAMGWGLRFPSLFNIYWHPAQMHAKFDGTLTIDDRTYIIENANGYQDRNWGRAFPKWWFWMSVQDFNENPNSSFVAGGGDARVSYGIPVPTAILMGLHHEGVLYEFRSSDFNHYFDWEIEMGQWKISAINRFHRIVVSASEERENMLDLPFYTPGGETFHDYETLTGTIHVELYKRRPLAIGWEKIADLSTPNKAGLELGLDEPYEEGLLIKKSF